METINLNKKVYAKNQYEKVIDTKFSQLATTVTITPETKSLEENYTQEINKFFDDYSRLFYVIPKTGETNSHEYLIKTSTEYIDYTPINNDIQALIDEINQLQKQNLELNQQIVSLTISGSQQI
jgi:hypothetical protein